MTTGMKINSKARRDEFHRNTEKLAVQFYRSDSPELCTINHITHRLPHKAVELNGDYDRLVMAVSRHSGSRVFTYLNDRSW